MNVDRFAPTPERTQRYPKRGDQAARCREINAGVMQVAFMIGRYVPQSLERDLALHSLDDVLLQSIEGIARHENWTVEPKETLVRPQGPEQADGYGGQGEAGQQAWDPSSQPLGAGLAAGYAVDVAQAKLAEAKRDADRRFRNERARGTHDYEPAAVGTLKAVHEITTNYL